MLRQTTTVDEKRPRENPQNPQESMQVLVADKTDAQLNGDTWQLWADSAYCSNKGEVSYLQD